MGVIDVHTHYLAEALVTAMESRTELPRISGTGDDRVIEYGPGNGAKLLPAMVDLERQEREMAEASVAAAVISINVPGVDWFTAADGAAVARDVNDELADMSRADPGRKAALAVLPLQAPDEAAAELERAVGLGLRGAMIYSNVAGEPLDPRAMGGLLDVAARHDVPIAIHPTYPLSARTMDAFALIPALGFLVDTTTAALRLILGGAYEERPGLKLYLCHSGSLLPQLAGRIDYESERHAPGGLGELDGLPSERMRLLYSDVVCAWPPALRSAMDLLGPDRIMFGSDYPFWEHGRTRDALDGAGFDPAVVERIERGNAEALFGPFDRS
jgi:aminocarboxymuconate-semialdehyde decarboxylase